MTTTYTLPKYPTYTQTSDLDTVVNGIYRHEYTLSQLEKLAKNLPDDVKRSIVREITGIAGEAIYCCRLAQEKARMLVEESFSDAEMEMTLQGTPIGGEPLPKDKALKLLMTANSDFVKQAATLKNLDREALVMDAIISKVREVLDPAQWMDFQRDLDQRIIAATRSQMG